MGTDFLSPQNSVSIYKGTSKTLVLTIKDSKLNVYDITGATLYFTVKSSITDVAPLITKTSGSISEIEITSAREGTAKIYISPIDTQALSAKQYVFDMLIVLSSGKRFLVIPPSVFEVEQPVTILP